MTTRFIRTLFVTTLIAAVPFVSSAQSLQQARAANDGTVIAYIKNSRDNQAIYMANPDGSNEREVWRVPQRVLAENGIGYIAWNPSATELAFDSGHISASLTIRDIYAVQPNGSGLRRITNAPHPTSYGALPKGEVTFSVLNVGVEGRILHVYVEGASAPIVWEAAAGARRDFNFPDVADFGDGVKQYAVVKYGNLCYYDVVAYADVQPGQIVRTTGNLTAGAAVATSMCAQPYHPAWTADGTQVGYLVYNQRGSTAQNDVWLSPALNVPLTNRGQQMFSVPPSGSPARFMSLFALGPTASRANEVIRDSQSNVGSPDFPPTLFKSPINEPALAEPVAINIEEPCPVQQNTGTYCKLLGLAWLPDGSGFVFSLIQKDITDRTKDINYLYKYDFASNATTRLAALGGGFVTDITIAPDMQQLAYARAEAQGAASDIWVINMDGGNPHKIVSDARYPVWSPRPPTSGTPGATPTSTPTAAGPTPTRNPALSPRVYLPLVLQSAQSTPAQPTATPTTPVGQPTRTPSPATSLINGNFDLGRNVGWAEYSPTGGAIISASTSFFVKPRSGTHVALFSFGSADGGTREISQTVQLPASATNLTFYYRWDSQDQTCSGDVARAFVGVGSTRQSLWSKVLCSQDYEGSDWFPVTVNLSSYAGQSVALVVQLQTNTTGQSTFAVDDVSLGSGGTPATPTPAPTATATPASATATPAQGGGISGRVTYKANAVNNITVKLLRCVLLENTCTVVSTGKTNANGQYLFTNLASLKTNESYIAGYVNGADGGNTDDANYLSYWRSIAIISYTAGAAADGGSFDIADIKLIAPVDNSTRSPPITFSWASRGVAGDSYAWGLSQLPGPFSYELCRSEAQSTTSFVATEAFGSQCLINYNTVYAWYVYVGKADGSAYGLSHDYRKITVGLPTAANAAPGPVASQ